jgi:hypothetical protein
MNIRISVPFSVLLFCFLPLSSKAQSFCEDAKYLKHCLKTLASDSMGGREPGTVYDMMAAGFIANEFQFSNIKPYKGNSYYQEFTYLRDSVNVRTRNVVAWINHKANKSIIITAHYDHLGFGGKRSRSFDRHEVHNGADDNASGVSLMLELAKQIEGLQLNRYNFIFISFSAHEDGLFGSDYFIKSGVVRDSSIKFMINMDMIGRADSLNPKVFISSNDTNMVKDFKKCVTSQDKIQVGDKEMVLGDHTALADKNVPVLFLTTGTEDDYHKVTDDESLINYPAMAAIEKLILRFIVKTNSLR